MKWGLVVFSSVILTTVGIDAADHAGNLRQSLVGRLFFAGTAEQGPCPAGMAQIITADREFCADLYEASAGQDCPASKVANQRDTRENVNAIGCYAESKPGVHPWTFISRDQAAAICAKSGKRLPTNAEWQVVALGTPDPAGGWGGKGCNVALNRPGQPDLTGAGADCRSGAGAFDMVGNVWEWVLGNVVDGKLEGVQLPPQGYIAGTDGAGLPSATSPEPDVNYNSDYFWIKTSGARAIARGGYWNNVERAGQYAAYIVSEPAFAGEGVGFRCVK